MGQMKRIHFFVFTQTNEEGGFVPCGLPVESVDCTDAAQNVSCPNCIDWMSKNITE
jgi:hypothetical protein